MTVETSFPLTSGPFVDALAADDATWFLGARTWLRATASQTGGAFGLVEQVIEPGFASPYHVHRNEDEAFYVIEGEVRFVSEGQSWFAGAGGFAFLPRNIPHGFRVEGDVPARVLLLVTPGGFEGFVAELSEPAPPAGPPDMGKLMQAAASYSIDILGPLPE
jgi:quercetin dioxygenase-like cupin family protein